MPASSASSERSAPFAVASTAGGLDHLRAWTLNHRGLGVDALQHVALDGHAALGLHQALTVAGIESLVLVTCNRTEIYWHSRSAADDARVAAACDAASGDGRGTWSAATAFTGPAVAAHLFRVCAGLESLVPGEAEILGQVRTALETCTGAGALLRGVGQAALRAGRMARAETAIGVGAQSVASAAVHLVASALPTGRGRVVVVGAGATGVKVATQLRALGLTDLLIVNRSVDRALDLAATIGADAASLAALPAALLTADAVVCAVHAPSPLVTLPALTVLAAQRRQRPLVVADISMPPAIEPGAAPGVIRVDLVAVEAFVARQRDQRIAEVPHVEAVLAREMRHLDTWVRRHTLRPLVSGLRRRVEAIRQAELARLHGELGTATAVDHAVLDRLSRRLLDQVLAAPLASLETGALPLDQTHADYLCRLFAIDRGVDA